MSCSFTVKEYPFERKIEVIRYIKGTYQMNLDGSVVIETPSGLGLEVFVPMNSPIYRYKEGDEIMVYTSMIVREDDISLYGFHNKETMQIFEKLITVNGVGAKAGMSILGTLSSEELKQAIAFGDVKAIQAANGIGKKTAERIILELKDKIDPMIDGTDHVSLEVNVGADNVNDAKSEAILALMELGYSRNEVLKALGKIEDSNLSAEEYIKKALRMLF